MVSIHGDRPFVFRLWRLLEYLAVLATLCQIRVASERVHITVISGGFSDIENAASQMQCYRSSPSSSASRDFGRTAPIPSDTWPEPPAAGSFANSARPCFEPEDERFTRTVNVGDTGVIIQMIATGSPGCPFGTIVWRKDGGAPVSGQTTTTFTFSNPIVAEDEGIYEIHYSNMRGQGRGALYRIIARDCPAGKWGPTDCTRICDKCYNGGVCDDETGRQGINCETVPDVCDVGYYGPDCTDKCHCLNDAPCDKITGECPNQLCAPYFNIYDGVNCQECPGAFYGLGCVQPCHCDESTCDKVSGICTGQCLPNWVERDCQTGISSLTSIKVNPNQPSSLTCVVEGKPPPNEADVSLYRLMDGVRGDSGISRNQSSLDASGEKLMVVFTISQETSGEYECALYGDQASLSVDIMTYVLPVLEAAPTVTASTSSSLTIEWMAWNEQTDIGDPPVTEYITYYRIPGGNWNDGQMVAASMTSATLTGLDPDTDY
ncbi:uncharacterized protein [Diadema antillarum]|uniref:uncharacterized protein n=1 Tax=Diadema antillarum TaxID=105358 RepID=UPI003A8525AF